MYQVQVDTRGVFWTLEVASGRSRVSALCNNNQQDRIDQSHSLSHSSLYRMVTRLSNAAMGNMDISDFGSAPTKGKCRDASAEEDGFAKQRMTRMGSSRSHLCVRPFVLVRVALTSESKALAR